MERLSNYLIFSVALVSLVAGFVATISFDSRTEIFMVGGLVSIGSLFVGLWQFRDCLWPWKSGEYSFLDSMPTKSSTELWQLRKSKLFAVEAAKLNGTTPGPNVNFVSISQQGKEESDLDNVFDLIGKLGEPRGRRLVITQLRSRTQLVDSLLEIVGENRSISNAVLRGVGKNTDLIAYGRLEGNGLNEDLIRFVRINYSEVLLCAPSDQRFEWLQMYSGLAVEEEYSESVAAQA